MVEGSHCMTPKYLATMLEMSRQNLGLETIDIYYVHNPETQLEAVERKEFLSRMAKTSSSSKARWPTEKSACMVSRRGTASGRSKPNADGSRSMS